MFVPTIKICGKCLSFFSGLNTTFTRLSGRSKGTDLICSSLEVCGHGQEIAPERQVLRHSADPFRGIGLFIVRGRIFARRNRVQCADRQSPRLHLQIVPVTAATGVQVSDYAIKNGQPILTSCAYPLTCFA